MQANWTKYAVMPGEFAFPNLPDNCPPADATERRIEQAFFFCYSVPVTEADFVPLASRGAARPLGSLEKECQACGISLYLDVADARNLAGEIPKFREMILVTVEITPDDGVIKHTQTRDRPSHHTLWPYRDAAFRDNVRAIPAEEVE
jgi:hypothetical protein